MNKEAKKNKVQVYGQRDGQFLLVKSGRLFKDSGVVGSLREIMETVGREAEVHFDEMAWENLYDAHLGRLTGSVLRPPEGK